MLDFISPIISLYEAFIGGIKSKKLKSQIEKEIRIRRKIIIIKLLFEDIIDTAEQIFSIIDTCINQEKEINKQTKKRLKYLLYYQRMNLGKLLNNLHDESSEYVFKLFEPQLQREIVLLINWKKGEISGIMKVLGYSESEELKKFFSKPYYDEGIKLLSELKSCSKDLSNFIRSNISLEDAILAF